MMTIKGRHIRKAIVDRRRMNSCKLRPAEGGRLKPRIAGDHVWTVSAIFTPLIPSDQPPITFDACRPPRPACGFFGGRLYAQSSFQFVLGPLDHVVDLL